MKILKTILSAMAGIAICTALLVGCGATGATADGTRVSTESAEFKAVTRAIQDTCNHPAEFGRCGCFMDGLETSCSIAQACLDAGFCKVARE